MANSKPLPKSKTRRLTADSIVKVKHPTTGAMVIVHQTAGVYCPTAMDMVWTWTDRHGASFTTAGVPPIYEIFGR